MIFGIHPHKLNYVCRCYKDNEVLGVFVKESLGHLLFNWDEREAEVNSGKWDFIIVTIYDDNNKVLNRELFSNGKGMRLFEELKAKDAATPVVK